MFILSGGIFWAVLGATLLLRPAWVLSTTANLSIRIYGKDSAYTKVFSRTPFGWFQRAFTGVPPDEFAASSARDPSAFPGVLWLIRFLGAFGLLFGLFAMVAGIGRLAS